jgi:hypothetical protein
MPTRKRENASVPLQVRHVSRSVNVARGAAAKTLRPPPLRALFQYVTVSMRTTAGSAVVDMLFVSN